MSGSSAGVIKHRQLAITLRIGKGNFGQDGYDTLKLSGPVRASATITLIGGPNMCRLDLRLYGLSFSHMNQFATLGPVINLGGTRNNEIVVEAGDTSGVLGTVFEGTVTSAYADMSSQPQVSMVVQANAGVIAALKPVDPSSYRGLTEVSAVIQELAKQAGKLFENNGVTDQIIDPYFPGTVWDQIDACAKSKNINWVLDAQTNTIAIWPKGQKRSGIVPTISPTNGMIGYPTFSATGVEINVLYRPTIQIGRTIKVESSIRGATGTYRVDGLTHLLEAETPGGQWFSHIIASPLGSFVVPTGR